jgi:hypothetical protein
MLPVNGCLSSQTCLWRCADLSTFVSEVAIMGAQDIPLLQKVCLNDTFMRM